MIQSVWGKFERDYFYLLAQWLSNQDFSGLVLKAMDNMGQELS